MITHMWNQRNDTNELIYKTEIDSWIYKTKLWLSKGKSGSGRYKLAGQDKHIHIATYKIKNKDPWHSTGNSSQ